MPSEGVCCSAILRMQAYQDDQLSDTLNPLLNSYIEMNIINLSPGDGSSYNPGPIAVLADRLVAQGVSVVGAAGTVVKRYAHPFQYWSVLYLATMITHCPSLAIP